MFIFIGVNVTAEDMDKVLELVMLIVLALGSAILFSFAMIWKFIQAIFQLVLGFFKPNVEA